MLINCLTWFWWGRRLGAGLLTKQAVSGPPDPRAVSRGCSCGNGREESVNEDGVRLDRNQIDTAE